MQQNNVRGARGVQEDEVWAAADAVLASGERPTIERVRQFLGRGSPNTVGPMLEAWYGSLAQRLKTPSAAADELPEEEGGDATLPPAVERAAKVLWGRAVQQAHQKAQDHAEAERTALEQRSQALDEAAQALAAERARLEDRAQALATALSAKDEQIADLGRQLTALQQRLGAQASEIDALRAQCSHLAAAAEGERQRLAASEDEHRKERERLEQRAAAQERRWLEEVDRARQDAKRSASLHAEEVAKALSALAKEQERAQALEAQRGNLQAENQALRTEVALARDDVSASRAQSLQFSAEMARLMQELREKLAREKRPGGLAARLARKPGRNAG
jgi:hypothetical protein